ncbi:MAG: hypothetical protein DK304_000048 [Chloroflexi bacterium]|jgi:hypothetical protein|nr:MAG: hypothetical protein DK304_000048 [Chloroflexota bacterium]
MYSECAENSSLKVERYIGSYSKTVFKELTLHKHFESFKLLFCN